MVVHFGGGQGRGWHRYAPWTEDNRLQVKGTAFLVKSQAASSTPPITSNNNTSPSIHSCIMNVTALLDTASQAIIDNLAAERTDELAVRAHGHVEKHTSALQPSLDTQTAPDGVEMLMDHIKPGGKNRHQQETLS